MECNFESGGTRKSRKIGGHDPDIDDIGSCPPILLRAVTCLLVLLCLSVPAGAAMSLKGLVEDEAGNPINDVTLHVRKGRLNLLSESFYSSSESKVELDDGKFRLSCFRCSTMRLFFRKKGFYSETVEFSNKSRQTTESQTRNALRIVLRRDWTVRLNGYYAYLRSNPNGPVTIAPIRRDLGNNVTLAALKQRPDREEGFLPGYIQLNVTNLHGDDTIAIDFSNVEGGAILYKYSKESPSKIFPSMETAPTDGYQET